ncbi:glutamine synthetase family protein [Streptomyces sp. NPDC014861]|uniref:glutamine synthetase family protein n=1 Tax=Streptomyces sp. NPDC014861 TaxID=3364923 RepID=UPI0036F78A80
MASRHSPDRVPDFVQLLFTDIAGRLKTLEIPGSRWEDVRESGWTVDGAVLLGHGDPAHSDLRLRPDESTRVRRPWCTASGLTVDLVFCDVLTPDGQPFAGDPRAVLRKAVEASEHREQRPVLGVEAEFYLLRPAADGTAARPADSHGYWDLGHDEQVDEVCRDVSQALELMGVTVDGHHHEVCPGQREIVFRHGGALETADRLLLLKHTARSMARRRGLKAVFMPKPLAELYGNALHVHVSLESTRSGATPLFHDASDPHGMSELFRHSLAGVLDHAPALTAIGNPTVNSYKRLVPRSGTPIHRSWARHNRSTAFKVCGDGRVPSSMRLELRSPDPAANPYLLFSGILAAFADGQDRKLELPDPCEDAVAELSDAELALRGIGALPTDLPDALRALGDDPVVRAGLGELATHAAVSSSRADWNAWHRLVTAWETERYAESE